MWVEKEAGKLLVSVDTVQEARENIFFVAHFLEKNKKAFKSCSLRDMGEGSIELSWLCQTNTVFSRPGFLLPRPCPAG